jgi:hypothetical protein
VTRLQRLPSTQREALLLVGASGFSYEEAAAISDTAVFELVSWWTVEGRALERAYKSLRLQRMCPFDGEEPFAAVIRCAADPTKVDKRTRSKWSRALRYTLKCKSNSEPLDQFIKRKGGINRCVSCFTRLLGPLCASGTHTRKMNLVK